MRPTKGMLVAVGGLWLLPLSAGALESAGAGAVSRVVVYPDRAQVTRSVAVACGDRVPVQFAALPPSADVASVRAYVSVGRIDGLRAEERALPSAYAKQIAELDDRLHRLDVEVQALQSAARRDETTLGLAAQYEALAQQLISRELTEPPQAAATAVGRGGATKAPATWGAALDSALSARMQVAAARAERAEKLRALGRQIDDLRQQRGQQQHAAAQRDVTADVLVSCPVGPRAVVDLTYMVGGAGFVPAHEARLEDRNGRVVLTSLATLRQSTGEDWRGARLTLSTAVPRQNATPPSVSPLRIYADPREPPKKVLVSRAEQHEHADAPSGGMPAGAESGGERNLGGRPQAQAQGLSVQFVIADSADVAGDGTPVRVVMAESALPAHVAYRAVPKLLPYVFRVADLNNTPQYPLLPGPIDVLRHGQFIARYDLPHVPAGGRFQLTFGLEDRLRVKRQIIDEVARDRGVLGGTRRHNYVYRFEISSFLDRPDVVELSEHIPVSELDDVKVALAPTTSGGHQLNSSDGIVSWKLSLSPGEKRQLTLAYYVDVPSSYSE